MRLCTLLGEDAYIYLIYQLFGYVWSLTIEILVLPIQLPHLNIKIQYLGTYLWRWYLPPLPGLKSQFVVIQHISLKESVQYPPYLTNPWIAFPRSKCYTRGNISHGPNGRRASPSSSSPAGLKLHCYRLCGNYDTCGSHILSLSRPLLPPNTYLGQFQTKSRTWSK